MARFQHTFHVRASLARTWEFHEDARQGLPTLTPPPLRVKILHIDEPMGRGSSVKFRLALFGIPPLGATWHAIYDEFDPYQPGSDRCGFVDRSLSSPFRHWVHRHTFRALPDGGSAITDSVEYRLFGGPLGEAVSWLVWPSVLFLFVYRRLATVRSLR